ncbi:MAG TPA: hypothetical protein EYH45_01130 [Candidatus Caldiarchaeum subterraneum]|uniref:Restriction endonuclease type IV Mrr domain-containing protein n=1 Tax=Caldiarchaeum subterraneum TaxID=311458 RepID=A0A832ZXJ0_CALS0|nr:hypothetical protein [Candidatus Caldarchaeum subterraneum]
MSTASTVNTLLAFLKVTSRGEAKVDASTVAEQANISREVVDGILGRYGLNLEDVTPSDRIRVMLEVVKLGYDAERAARYLDWRELEEYVSEIASRYGLKTVKNLRYKVDKRRYEVDVVAAGESNAFIFDCKRWKKRLSGKTLLEIADKQAERTYALGRFLNRIAANEETTVRLTPAVLTLHEPDNRIVKGIPVIPIYTLISFLEEGAYSDELLSIKVRIDKNWFGKLLGKQLKLIS